MNQNTKDNLYKNNCELSLKKSSIKQKKYSCPTIMNIGDVNKKTLGGATNPNLDSGSNLTS